MNSSGQAMTPRPDSKPPPAANNLVEITVDTSSCLVDIRQQDSGSNQSGSDSGLGYTNSISSDNSTCNAASQDQQAAGKNNSEHIINSSSTNFACPKLNNNRSQIKPQPQSQLQRRLHHQQQQQEEASSCTHSTLGSIDETRANSDEPISKQPPQQQALLKPQNATHPDHQADEMEGRSADTRNELVNAPPSVQTVIKSLLKKSSHLTGAPKHNRSVSFNQTVIVFCEEIEAPSPGDQYEPPIDYQDSVSSFEPPEDYCDHGTERKGKPLIDEGGFDEAIRGDASNLTDEQLFGLLDNESFIHNFRLNCEDLSEDDFPINYLNSNHSYLCSDAISDYDSDSESSLCVERKESKPEQAVTNSYSTLSRTTPTDLIPSKNREKVVEPSVLETQVKSDSIDDTICASRSSQADLNAEPKIQKSMPARMKVSTVDSNIARRQSNRTESHDLKKSGNYDGSGSNQSISNRLPQAEITLPGPMLIKQSVVEPISLSKPIIVENSFTEADQKKNPSEPTIYSAPKPLSFAPSKQADLIMGDHNQSRETVSLSQKLQSLNQADTTTNPVQSFASQQPACQICRVIESTRTQTNNVTTGENLQKITSSNENNNNQRVGFLGHSIHTSVNQPVVQNQSCVSCRESLMRQNTANTSLNAQMTGVAQQTTPLACQLVYVVDQKGNRVRALSVVGPSIRGSNILGQGTLAGRRIIIAPNGVRFPNPIAVNGQAINRMSPQQLNQNLIVANRAQQAFNVGQAHMSQSQFVLGQNNFDPRASGSLIPSSQKVPVEALGTRQHTVYYVRQPLCTQNIRQSFDSTGSSSKSFPDPHEIRRLDGLRGPTSSLNLVHREDQKNVCKTATPNTEFYRNSQSHDATRVAVNLSRDETDDPTFGFSKRPSVKVVATNSNMPINTIGMRSQPSSFNYDATIKQDTLNLSSNRSATQQISTQTNVVRPASLVVMGSQTLDRRKMTQQHQSMKENIPGTSSMSNIHGIYTNQPEKRITSANPQPRVSENQVWNYQTKTNLNPKGSKPDSFFLDSNDKAMIPGCQLAPHQAQGCQTSSNPSSTLFNQPRKTQGRPEVAYTMNI